MAPLVLEDEPVGSHRLMELLKHTGELAYEMEATLWRVRLELERWQDRPDAGPPTFRPRGCPGLDSLSPRELEIVKLFMAGSRVSNIARRLCISRHTVRNHLQSVYRKLGVGSQAELAEKLGGLAAVSAVPGEFP